MDDTQKLSEDGSPSSKKLRLSIDNDHGLNEEADLTYTSVNYDTSSPFPPVLLQRGTVLDQILENGMKTDLYPPQLVKTLEADAGCKTLIQHLREYIKDDGHCLISVSLPATCNLYSSKKPPSNVVCDALVVTTVYPPVLVTFTLKLPDQDSIDYNKSVAKALMYSRYFTDEDFDILYGVVSIQAVKTSKLFKDEFEEIRKKTSKYCIPSNLLMSSKRCQKIYRAILTCTAITRIPPPDSVDRQSNYVLDPKMYTSLMACLSSLRRQPIKTMVDRYDKYFMSVLAERQSKIDMTIDANEGASEEASLNETLDKSTENGNVQVSERQLTCTRNRKFQQQTGAADSQTWIFPLKDDVFSTKHPSDTSTPDLCEVESFSGPIFTNIVVADTANKCLKQIFGSLPRHNLVINRLALSGKPRGLAKFSNKKLIVSLPAEKKLCVVLLHPDLQVTQTIDTEKEYHGIARIDSTFLAVCSPKDSSVDVLDVTDFTVKKTISSCTIKYELGKPHFVCGTNDGGFIISDSCANSVTKFSRTGEVIFEYKENVLCPRGISVDCKGDVYFADTVRKGIVQLSSSGDLKQICTNSYISKPTGLCCEGNDRLLVTSKDKIHVVSLGNFQE